MLLPLPMLTCPSTTALGATNTPAALAGVTIESLPGGARSRSPARGGAAGASETTPAPLTWI